MRRRDKETAINKTISTLPSDDDQKQFDHSLVKKISLDDHASFEYLFRTYYADIVRFSTRMVKSQPAAEELVQEVFVRIWENRKSWEIHGTIRSYLYGAARNRAMNYLRQNKLNTSLDETDHFSETHSHTTSADLLHAKDLEAAIMKAIALLPERSRLIFLMHREEGLTYPEIASALQISVNTVETQMARALRKLRILLSDFLPIALILWIVKILLC